jgi:hypothetical protein
MITQNEFLPRPCGNRSVEMQRRHRRLARLDGLGGEERDTAGKVLGADMQVGRRPMA